MRHSTAWNERMSSDQRELVYFIETLGFSQDLRQSTLFCSLIPQPRTNTGVYLDMVIVNRPFGNLLNLVEFEKHFLLADLRMRE